ncbi:MAG: 3'-5' exonuclease domain-containing protein 2 [Chitinispirillaceae bacterium]|nr:3'-5' exonuclease domain-containing protein 2 [Chitinispirillaceae bacterium]
MIPRIPNPRLLPTRDTIRTMPPFDGLDLENIRLVTTPAEATAALNALRGHSFIGFDTESRPTFIKGQRSAGPHVLQFATPDCAYIFQTCHRLCEPVVAKILESNRLVKVGFGLNDDIKRIAGKLHIHPKAVIDLDAVFKINFELKNSIGVKTAIAFLFKKRFVKSHKSTTSNWSNRTLSERQLLYAANDAWAALIVFRELERIGVDFSQRQYQKPLSTKR